MFEPRMLNRTTSAYGAPGLSLHDLTGYRWITPLPDTPARALLSHAFAALNQPEPTAVVETGDATIVRAPRERRLTCGRLG